jgi:CDP-glycerol glycerophosphotransferase
MDAPITVVIPAWDIDAELRECVASVWTQDEPATVVVVDNASSNPLPDVGPVTYVRLPERVSVGAARNAGLAAVCTEYVMFLDGDDRLLPGALRYLRSAFDSRPEAVALAGGMLAWNPNTDVRQAKTWPFPYAYRLQRHVTLFAALNAIRALFPITGPVLIRTELARFAGGFCESGWGEDWCLGAALCFAGRVVMCRRDCMLYRIDPTRASLSDYKEGRWGPSWAGRRAVRRKLRNAAPVPSWARFGSPLLVPFHFFFTVQDLYLGRQRV